MLKIAAEGHPKIKFNTMELNAMAPAHIPLIQCANLIRTLIITWLLDVNQLTRTSPTWNGWGGDHAKLNPRGSQAP